MPLNATFDQLKFSLLLNTVLPAGLASLAYFMSGFDYNHRMTQLRMDRTLALALALK